MANKTFNEVSPKEVLFDFGISYKEEKNSGELIADCPFCGARRKFQASNLKNCFHCWVCDAHGGTKDLVEMLGGDWDNYSDRSYTKMSGYRKPNYNAWKKSSTASVAKLNECYSFLFSHCQLNPKHKQALLDRGLSEAEIKKLGYKSFPGYKKISSIEEIMKKEKLDFSGVPGFYKPKDNWQIIDAKPGIMIPVRYSDGRIVGVQIRHDEHTNGPKYSWLSTNPESKRKDGKQAFPNGSKAFPWAHCFISDIEPKEDKNASLVIYLTEGPLKADVVGVKCNKNVIAIPGTATYKNMFSVLGFFSKKYKNRKIILVEAFDMDKTTNPNVKRNVDKIKSLISEQFPKMKLETLCWDTISVQGNPVWLGNYKGIDDFVVRNKNKKKL